MSPLLVRNMLFGKSSQEDETLVAILASALRRDISFGALLPDQKLKIADLRQRYGGSNHSMRETLRLLSAEGLVEATAQRGFRVTSATQEDLQDIIFVRLHIEEAGLKLAIELGNVDWEARLVAAHHGLRKAEEAVENNPDDLTALQWDEACRIFSATIIEASGSRRLIDLQKKFFDQSRRFRLTMMREGRLDFSQRAAWQGKLLKSVLARDCDGALSALRQDINSDLEAGPY